MRFGRKRLRKCYIQIGKTAWIYVHGGFQEEQTDVAEVKDVAEDEPEGGKWRQIRERLEVVLYC